MNELMQVLATLQEVQARTPQPTAAIRVPAQPANSRQLESVQ